MRVSFTRIKIITGGVARGYPGLDIVEVFFVGLWKNLLELSLLFLKFRMLWLMSMRLHMLWRKLKRLDLLMSGWNTCLNYFRIDEILVLLTMGKSGLGLLFAKKMRELISSNLGFLHREFFH